MAQRLPNLGTGAGGVPNLTTHLRHFLLHTLGEYPKYRSRIGLDRVRGASTRIWDMRTLGVALIRKVS